MRQAPIDRELEHIRGLREALIDRELERIAARLDPGSIAALQSQLAAQRQAWIAAAQKRGRELERRKRRAWFFVIAAVALWALGLAVAWIVATALVDAVPL